MQQPVLGGSGQPGRLLNGNREVLAFGDCELRQDGEITMRVEEEHVHRPHQSVGELSLLLDDGRAIGVSNRFVRLQVRGGEGRPSTIYRLHIKN